MTQVCISHDVLNNMPMGIYQHQPHSEETRMKMSETHKRNIANGTSKSRVFKKGNIPPFKGIKGIHLSPETEFKKGITPNGSYVFIKGVRRFKGDINDYKKLHRKVGQYFGKPDTCEHCGKSGLKGRQIDWANVTGNYLMRREDWIRLCRKCHYNFDKQYLRKEQHFV